MFTPSHRPLVGAADAELAAIFNGLPDGVVLLDERLRVIRGNAAASEILGGSPEQIIGERAGEGLVRIAARALGRGEAQRDVTIGFGAPDAPARWLSVTAAPLTPSRVLISFRDVSAARARAEADELARGQIFDRQQFLDTTLNALPCLVSYVDQRHVYRYCNRAYEQWFQIDRHQFIGHSVESLLGPTAYASVRPHLVKGLSGSTSRFDAELKYQLMGPKSVSATYIPDFNSRGQVLGVYCIILDLTPQTQDRQLIERKEQEIIKLINNIPGMVGWWDKDQRNLHANRAYANYFGRLPDQIRGRHVRDVLGEVLYGLNRPFIEAVLDGEPQNFERTITLPDGNLRHVLTSYVPDLVDGAVAGFFAATTDISRLKEAEAMQRKAEAQLISNAKMAALGEMAGGIAHEINNPLAIIYGKAGQIHRALGDPVVDLDEVSAGVSKIEATAERIAKIVKGLRTFSRNADADPLEISSVGQIVEDTLDLLAEKFVRSGVVFNVGPIPNVTLECRPVEISQVLMNLLSNAFHAVEDLPDKWITLDVGVADGLMRFVVTDGGPGISPEVRQKMMQPFFTTKPVGQGTGLGLSISKGIAEAHGGTLRFDEGAASTRFVLEVPRVRRV